jgi:hypothetical protein
MIQNLINHIVFVNDASGSMRGIADDVVKVFDSQVTHLARRSQELNQETRASVYLFNSQVSNLLYDMDVMRLPSLKGYYKTSGQTALIDATIQAIEDLKQTAQLYGDHSFLIYVLTDGGENASAQSSASLSVLIKKLPENWTVAALVPDQIGVLECKRFGFAASNIQVWNSTSREGVAEVGETIRKATDSYMTGRASGVRGTKNLFNLDVSNLTPNVVKSNLVQLPPHEYEVYSVHRDSVIKPFVESWTGKDYVIGSAYYQLTKPEAVQARKQICVQDKANGRVYSGSNARQLLGLPDYEVKVAPADYSKYTVYVQSTSVNRKLVMGTQLIVLK